MEFSEYIADVEMSTATHCLVTTAVVAVVVKTAYIGFVDVVVVAKAALLS